MKKYKREISYKLCSGMQFKFTYYSSEAICFILIFHLFISFPRDWALDVDGSLQITLHGTWQNFSSFFYIPTSTLLSSLERAKKGGPQFINGSSSVNDYPRVRDDTFFRDLRSLTIILPNHDLRSLTIIFWKSHDWRSRSWSAIILPITINVSMKDMKT